MTASVTPGSKHGRLPPLRHRGSRAPTWTLRGLGGWSGLGGELALIIHATQQVISAHPEYRCDLDEQLCTRLLFALLDLGEMLSWLFQPPCQLALIPSSLSARLTDPLSN
jgi:hypothetical protein